MPENQNEKNDVSSTIEVIAKSVDAAIESGLEQLGLTQEQVHIEVVSEGKRGVFGLGAEEACVRITPLAQTGVEHTESQRPKPVKDVGAPGPTDEESVGVVGTEYLMGLLQRMGIEAEVTVEFPPELAEPDQYPPLVLDVKGKDLGILIGRRSETLQVLQYMVRLMVSKHFNRWEPVIVDVESYRVRRRRSLQKMAEKMAERAINTQRRVVLEAMPAHERRLIHLALRDHPKIITKSIGSDDNRKVTIVPR